MAEEDLGFSPDSFSKRLVTTIAIISVGRDFSFLLSHLQELSLTFLQVLEGV